MILSLHTVCINADEPSSALVRSVVCINVILFGHSDRYLSKRLLIKTAPYYSVACGDKAVIIEVPFIVELVLVCQYDYQKSHVTSAYFFGRIPTDDIEKLYKLSGTAKAFDARCDRINMTTSKLSYTEFPSLERTSRYSF